MHWPSHFSLQHFGRQMSSRKAAFYPIEIFYEGELHFAQVVDEKLKVEGATWLTFDLSPQTTAQRSG